MYSDEYYDRLVLGNSGYEKKKAEEHKDLERQRQDQERISNKTWGMGVNE